MHDTCLLAYAPQKKAHRYLTLFHHHANTGVYFEANGHGTVLFSDALTRALLEVGGWVSDSSIRRLVGWLTGWLIDLLVSPAYVSRHM